MMRYADLHSLYIITVRRLLYLLPLITQLFAGVICGKHLVHFLFPSCIVRRKLSLNETNIEGNLRREQSYQCDMHMNRALY